MRHPSSQRFHDILAEHGEMHDRKQADYGTDTDPFANVRSTEDWGVPAWTGAMIRLNDKVQRIKSLIKNGKLYNESAEDSLRDIAVYATIALVLWEDEQAQDAEATAIAALEETMERAKLAAVTEEDIQQDAYEQIREDACSTPLGRWFWELEHATDLS